MIPIELILSDPTICDPSIVATWSGQQPLFAHILNAVFQEQRQREVESRKPENQSEPDYTPKGFVEQPGHKSRRRRSVA